MRGLIEVAINIPFFLIGLFFYVIISRVKNAGGFLLVVTIFSILVISYTLFCIEFFEINF